MIKNLILAAAFVLCGVASRAQVKAVTETGEEVVLYSDGTWKSTAAPKAGWNTRLDTPSVKKGEKSTFLVKGKMLKYGIWTNAKKWTFSSDKMPSVPAAEYFFKLKDGDAFAMTVPEEVQVNFEALPALGLKIAQAADPNARITLEENRLVNGVLVKYVEMKVSAQGMDLVYVGYYYSGAQGIIRFMAFTSANLLPKYHKDMEELLNGFTMEVK